MSDLIDRDKAIDCLNDNFSISDKRDAITVQQYIHRIYMRLRELPSAQPDIARDIATILENEQDMRVILQNAQPTQNNAVQRVESVGDCISRQAAIDAIGEIHSLDYNAQAIKARIEQLPSAQSALDEAYAHGYTDAEADFHKWRKTGTWIAIAKNLHKCSVCGDYVEYALYHGYNYCPNCGAEMVGETNETD